MDGTLSGPQPRQSSADRGSTPREAPDYGGREHAGNLRIPRILPTDSPVNSPLMGICWEHAHPLQIPSTSPTASADFNCKGDLPAQNHLSDRDVVRYRPAIVSIHILTSYFLHPLCMPISPLSGCPTFIDHHRSRLTRLPTWCHCAGGYGYELIRLGLIGPVCMIYREV
ncbi:hypothetical protein BD310DRAFT_340015 [Dichomitus squalens]|uniref:Uncharacterized protein n=1 Tax=Dichomitus squalens TaxID=114155 RepID=A0A4Q9PZL9_9APHY|nr:hypothetical protein BD310DRAFT_340015 [Dichomitus squalens]